MGPAHGTTPRSLNGIPVMCRVAVDGIGRSEEKGTEEENAGREDGN
jgi:hypothetical protein